jgi:hypothetical protein
LSTHAGQSRRGIWIKGIKEGDARIDKGTPAFLALIALHPLLVERDEARVRRSRIFGKLAKGMLEYLVVVSAVPHTTMNFDRPSISEESEEDVRSPRKLQRARGYLLEQVPIGLDKHAQKKRRKVTSEQA